MNFGDAITALKDGKKVARSGWNPLNTWIILVPTSNVVLSFSAPIRPWIGMHNADGTFVPWHPSQVDVLAENWLVIE